MWVVQRAVALAHCCFCLMLHLCVKSVSSKRRQSSAKIWCSVLLARLTGISVTTSWSAICPFICSNWEVWLVVLPKSECVIISWDVITHVYLTLTLRVTRVSYRQSAVESPSGWVFPKCHLLRIFIFFILYNIPAVHGFEYPLA